MVRPQRDAVPYTVLALWNLTHWLCGSAMASYHAAAFAVHASSLACLLGAPQYYSKQVRLSLICGVRLLYRAVPLLVALQSAHNAQPLHASLSPEELLLAQAVDTYRSSVHILSVSSWAASLLFWHTLLFTVSNSIVVKRSCSTMQTVMYQRGTAAKALQCWLDLH